MLKSSPSGSLNQYPREEISPESKQFISSLDMKYVFFQAVEINHKEDEQGEHFGQATIEQALLYTFHRLSYQLFYELRSRGEVLKMAHLMEILSRLGKVFDAAVQSETSFVDVIAWDYTLPMMFESLSNFKIAGNEFVGDDLVEDLALKSIASKESEKAAMLRIDAVVDEVRTAFKLTLPRTDQIEVFEDDIDTHVTNYSEYRNRVNDPDTFLIGVIDEVENLCLGAFKSNQEVINGETKLRNLVKKELSKYDALIDLYTLQIVSLLKTDFNLRATATVDGIWSAIVQVVIDNYRDSLEDESARALPEVSATRKSGPMMN